MSLTILRGRLLSLTAVVAAATAGAVGLTAAPSLADQVRSQEWWLATVHITQAWQASRGTGVTVAVLDTGVDPAQPDLSGSVITGPDYTHSGRRPGGGYWGGHGTAMAAIIAGHGHGAGQSDGIIGVAPGAKILSVRVNLEESDPLRADTAVTSGLPAAIAAGIRYAVRHGAQVIDLPVDPGAGYADGSPGAGAAAGGAAAERKAVAYALARGAVLVAPAGDDGPGPGQVNYPAAYPGVISVGAFSKGFVKARFSNRRSYVTLTAPGVDLITASHAAGYATVSSTGAASATVAGISALIRARYPRLTPQEVSQALTEGVRFHPAGGRRTGSGYGTADAVRALAAAARIESASQQTGPATAATPPPSTASRPAPASRRAALSRDAIIGGAALLLLIAFVLAIRVGRRRRARGRPPSGPQPTRPLSVRVTAPRALTAGDVEPWQSVPSQHQRPQLAPVPRLDAGRPGRISSAGPPWEAAPKPDGEPPWVAPEPGARDGIDRGHPFGAPGINGQAEIVKRAPAALPPADPEAPGPPSGAGRSWDSGWPQDGAPLPGAGRSPGGPWSQGSEPSQGVPWPRSEPSQGGEPWPRSEPSPGGEPWLSAEPDRPAQAGWTPDHAQGSGPIYVWHPDTRADAQPRREVPASPVPPRRDRDTGPLRAWPNAYPGDQEPLPPPPPTFPARPAPSAFEAPPVPPAPPAFQAAPTASVPPAPPAFPAPPAPSVPPASPALPVRPASFGADTQEFPALPGQYLGGYLEDDEDDRHL